MESGFYDCQKAWEEILTGVHPKEPAKKAIYSDWSESNEFRYCRDYMADQVFSDRPLILAGIDCLFNGKYSTDYFVNDLEDLLTRLGLPTDQRDGWADFTEILGRVVDQTRPYVAVPHDFYDTLDDLINEVGQYASNDSEAVWWWWGLANVETAAWLADAAYDRDTRTLDNQFYFNLRSERMGYNLMYLAKYRFPDKKIVVWTESTHICRNLLYWDYHYSGTWTETYFLTMGDIAWHCLGHDVYALGFTSYAGSTSLNMQVGDTHTFEDLVTYGDLEELMNAAGMTYAMLDFRLLNDFRNPAQNHMPPESGAWLRWDAYLMPWGYRRFNYDWTTVLDGLIFIRTMTPSTPAPL
jgi:erythromycin esterase